MRPIQTLDEARKVTAIRLTENRRFAKVGDIFRLSPYPDVVLWGRVIKKARFFGRDFEANLVYIYDVISRECPSPELLVPSNLIIGPELVNNLGWVRGYWEITSSQPLQPGDICDRHLFVRYQNPQVYDLIDEDGRVVVDRAIDPKSLGGSGLGNFNYIDYLVRGILEARGVIPS